LQRGLSAIAELLVDSMGRSLRTIFALTDEPVADSFHTKKL